MHYLSILAKAISVGLTIWLLGRGIRTSHRLDRAGSMLRWSVVVVSTALYVLSLRRYFLPQAVQWTAIFAFTLFFFLPDLSYYLVWAIRVVFGANHRNENKERKQTELP